MSEKKKLEVHLQLSVFRNKERFQVVNIATFYGLEQPYVFAYGFDENGTPFTNQNTNPLFKCSGNICGNVNLNIPFNNGITVKDKKIFGFDAVQIMVSNYGLHIPKSQIEEKIKTLIENDAKTIYFYKQSSVYGMAKAYGFKDSWLISGKQAETDLEYWNKFLKSLGSSWRILTPKTRLLLRKLEYEKLKAEGV